MRFVISGYYGFNNSGDDALLMSIISDIKSLDDDAKITVLSNSPSDTKKAYGVDAVNRYNIFSITAEIMRCDLLISGGGTLIQDETSTKSLLYYLFVIKLAKILKKKVMLYANGIGPLNSFKNIEKTKRVLNETDAITLRDEKSAQEMEHIGITRPSIRLTADPAFLIEPDENGPSMLENYGVPKNVPLMCVSVREWKNNPENFDAVIADFCDYAYEKYGLFTVFVPMQQKLDYALASSAKSKMRNRSVVIGANYPVETILSLMSQMTLCVAMRLHTIIYSSSSIVPSIGIVYDPKITGIMEYMGQDRMVKVEDVTKEELASLLDSLCDEYDSIKSRLKYNVQNLKEKASENISVMKDLLEKNK